MHVKLILNFEKEYLNLKIQNSNLFFKNLLLFYCIFLLKFFLILFIYLYFTKFKLDIINLVLKFKSKNKI